MKKLTRLTNILLAVTVIAMASVFGSCSDEVLNSAVSNGEYDDIIFNADGTMTITAHAEIPLIAQATSRAMSDQPNYDELNLYLFIYDSDGLRQYTKVEQQIKDVDDVHGKNTLITFSVTLEPTEKPVTAHLIATNDPGIEMQFGYDTHDKMIPNLYTMYPYEAYWQFLDLGSNIPSAEQIDPENGRYSTESVAKAKNIRDQFKHIAMIRNFCRVSISCDPKVVVENNFHLNGIYVMNTPDRGSVAPHVTSSTAAVHYVDYFNAPAKEGDPYQPKSYQEVSEQGHIGSLPSETDLLNTDKSHEDMNEAKSEDEEGNLSPVYFYERPGHEDRTDRTYVIIRGKFITPNMTEEQKAKAPNRYYKLDIGNIIDGDRIGRFGYYDLLRNFDYHISLHAVESDGYGTFLEACNGVVFNNFSASVEAKSMYSISDGDDMIFVNRTSFVFTQPGQEIEVLAQFREEINNANGGVERNNLLKYEFEPEEGDVIASYTVTENHDASETSFDSWNSYKLVGKDPTNDLKYQYLYIYRGNKAAPGEPVNYGLYRTITLISHVPWSFDNIDIVPGLYHSIEEIPNFEWHDEQTREIGQGRGSGMTLFFELPAGLPQAIFPLEFVIEADRQNVQNAYTGQCFVRSVSNEESLFHVDPTEGIGTPTSSRIQYVRTVRWEDYESIDENSTLSNGNRIIDCQFLTITDMDETNIGNQATGKSKTTLRVYNEYFGQWDEKKGWVLYHEDAVYRDQYTPDPTPVTWDFRTSDWMKNYRNTFNSSSRNNFNNAVFTGLSFTDGGTRTLRHEYEWFDKYKKNGKKDGGYNIGFIRMRDDADVIKYNVAYKAGSVPAGGEAIIEVCSSQPNNQGYYTGLQPSLTFTGGVDSYDVSDKVDPNIVSDKDKRPKHTYVYTIKLKEGATSLGIEIRRPAGKDLYISSMAFWPNGHQSM